ncbi:MULTISPECIES: methionine ABC transporter permease [Helcobacillus]|uniref:D-methionine transport system permease protein n=1 Tax=Helcobacillus massiliensis TaxID=521392 RepID=A0A839QXW2_9MICO|nr:MULTISPECIES: methionine ABC transporter permease [Helcobacillus]MBB3023680.1 D-methionine transport system permease protein [Helcobacillus massiliensis]MCG7428086.1 ABC transporter permease [Helcobacillus sp. ACRRO]
MNKLSEWFSDPVFTSTTVNSSLWINTWLTIYMTLWTMILTVLIGVPLGVLLFETRRSRSALARRLNAVVGFIVNVLRSFPFVILIIALIPLTSAIMGRATGPDAAIVSLTIASVPFLARLVEAALRDLPAGKIEAVAMMGASRMQIIRQVLIAEAMPGLIAAITTTTIAVIGYTAMAGTVGAGGLGDLAFRRGYQNYNSLVMVATVVVLVVIVILVQVIGDWLARRVDHRARS